MIERCGWEYAGSMSGGSDHTVEDEYRKSENLVDYKMYKARNHDSISISGWYHDNPKNPSTMTLFRGKCPSINELKTLMKWLQINSTES